MMAISSEHDRLYFPATERNCVPIGNALSKILPDTGSILEIASGSGEHAVVFQRLFPWLLWQASDSNPVHCKSIAAWIHHENLSSVMPQPLELDVLDNSWMIPEIVLSQLKIVISINLIHIAPWRCCVSLIQHSSEYLPVGGRLVFYGPFRRNGEHISVSNEIFDHSLRQRNSSWGVRDLESVVELCTYYGMELMDIDDLPANNIFVNFKKK